MIQVQEVRVGNFKIGGNNPMAIVAGPCVIESEKHCLMMAEKLRAVFDEKKIPCVFKSSYDKANRTSIRSFRGLGIKKGLQVLSKVKKNIEVPVLTDVHEIEEVKRASEDIDILQIPAFLCRQTNLIAAAAQSGRVVNIKKGQFLAPWDVQGILEKARNAGAKNILITERGVSFGYNNLVSDMRSLPIIRSFGCPVIFDATHSVQLPGGRGDRSGGQREFVFPLARAAAAAGCDGIFMEVHQDPDRAPSDGPNMVKLKDLPSLLDQLKAVDDLVRDLGVR